MTRRWWVPSVVLLAVAPIVVGAAGADPRPIEFADARYSFEVLAIEAGGKRDHSKGLVAR